MKRSVIIWGIAIAVIVVFAGALIYHDQSGESASDAAARRVGSSECKRESGLPGAAAGKMYDVVGEYEAPYVFERYAYNAGDRIYIGYCDANGQLIH